MSGEATEWIPLFPETEIDFILDAVLRCGRHLQKAAATELETRISSRLRDRLVRRRRGQESLREAEM
jgi:hypothetical protein